MHEEHGVVAYLGVPLVGKRGEAYGAVCAIDSSPRSWSCDDVRELERVAAQHGLERVRRSRGLVWETVQFDAAVS